ncbi:MAG: hypothetical protein KBC56_05865 [Flavobacterium sp.]|nr:hypothetical protein [Flavobacterium sp.]
MKFSSIYKHTFVFVLALLLFTTQFHAQSASSNELVKIDQTIGYQNLPYINGKLHLNYDNTINKNNHRYFDENEFTSGDITYNGQNYFGLKLKYDLKEDVLVCLPDQENNYIKINLISDYITEFSLGNKKFKNLTNELKAKFKKGFYEKKIETKQATLYIKHSKSALEIVKNNNTQKEYFLKKEHLIFAKNNYFPVDSERDLIEIFPEMKAEIKSYYEKNEKLEKDNQTEFIIAFLKLLK